MLQSPAPINPPPPRRRPLLPSPPLWLSVSMALALHSLLLFLPLLPLSSPPWHAVELTHPPTIKTAGTPQGSDRGRVIKPAIVWQKKSPPPLTTPLIPKPHSRRPSPPPVPSILSTAQGLPWPPMSQRPPQPIPPATFRPQSSRPLSSYPYLRQSLDALQSSQLKVAFIPPRGVKVSQLNQWEQVFYSFNLRIHEVYANSLITSHINYVKQNPHAFQQGFLPSAEILRAIVRFDHLGNMQKINVLRWSQNDDIQNIFLKSLENIKAIPNPPQSLVKNHRHFDLYFNLIVK